MSPYSSEEYDELSGGDNEFKDSEIIGDGIIYLFNIVILIID